MKKITTIILMATLLAALTGCDKNGTSEDSANTNSSDMSSTADSTSLSSDNSEPQTSEGEPTFLTTPDGTAIRTSEITKMYTGSEEDGNKKEITLAEIEKLAREGGYFTVKCDGFTYAYFPERTLNRFDDPDKFKENSDGGYDYIGGDSQKDVDLIDFIRVKPGDKFDSLTVKNAYMLFGKNEFIEEGLSDVPGAYVTGSCVEFDGEVELEGFLNVSSEDALYGMGGDMTFFPNGESSVKIPSTSYYCDKGYLEPHYTMFARGEGWFGSDWFNLGNINEVECDVSGIKPGDEFIRVKAVLGNIRITKWDNDITRRDFDLKSVDIV